MKKLAAGLIMLGLVGSSPSLAVIGTIDNVPAATLLLPYFEVDLDNPNGATTVFSINNASDNGVLAHVSLWSDLSVHVFDFMVYLTGYDVVTINLRDVIVNGRVPATASASQDPTDQISPQGPFSGDSGFATCDGIFPLPQVPQILVDHLQNALTGQPSEVFLGACAGQDLGDRMARGYIVVNTVNFCTLDWPGIPGYFVAGGNGAASNENVLWGDYFYIDPEESFAEGEVMVPIEADDTDPETSVPGEYTFFGRYVGWTADDNREPLSTTFAARFANGGAFSGGTELTVWRDSKIDQQPFLCGTVPVYYPLSQTQLVIFDEQENVAMLPRSPFSPPLPGPTLLPFPAETNRTKVGGPDLPVPWAFGWLYLNMNTTVPLAGNAPPEAPDTAQAWVTTLMNASGQFSVGYQAIQLDSATNTTNPILMQP